MKKKNGKKPCLWCIVPQGVILLYAIFMLPFIVNGFSFSFLRNVCFWGAILPIFIIVPLTIFCINEENKLDETEKMNKTHEKDIDQKNCRTEEL
ncbi:hypothetical protein [Clostridium sp. DL1XJH146]